MTATVAAAPRSVRAVDKPRRDGARVHGRCGLAWAEHGDSGPPWFWPRCADEPPDGHPTGPDDEWTQQRLDAQRKDKRPSSQARPRQADPTIPVLNTDGRIVWTEGDT